MGEYLNSNTSSHLPGSPVDPHNAPVDATWAWNLDTLPVGTGTIVVNIYPDSISQDSTKSSSEGSAHQYHTSNSSTAALFGALRFLLDHVCAGNDLVKLLLSVHSGYIIQSDFLDRRMIECLHVTKIQGFITPG
jgi:hypothetical protein